MPMTPREMIKYLRENGFEQVAQNGYCYRTSDRSSLSHQKPEKRSGAGYFKTGRSKITLFFGLWRY